MTVARDRAPHRVRLTPMERDRLTERLAQVERKALDLTATLSDVLEVVRDTPTTVPVAAVPVDGSVEVRGVTFAGRLGSWGHVIGEQQAVGGDDNRSLLIDGLTEPWTWHRDAHVQVRPFRDQELRWENVR